jgi:hypothetical protein
VKSFDGRLTISVEELKSTFLEKKLNLENVETKLGGRLGCMYEEIPNAKIDYRAAALKDVWKI